MYNKTIKLNEEKFRRKTGVKRFTFLTMVNIVRNYRDKVHKVGGRKMKLSIEDQVLLTLEYLREYTTYFSLGEKYDISESNCYKIVKKTEDILIEAKEFRLPNKREIEGDIDLEIVVVDASESRIQRPKKSKETTTQERKRHTP